MDYLSTMFSAGVWGTPLPASPQWIKWHHISRGKTHCKTCKKLDKCCFLKAKSPKWPQHEFCHCVQQAVSYSDMLRKASASAVYSKFDPYLFNTKNQYSHHKEVLFEAWGYSVNDSSWLKAEIEKQALEKYLSGDYALGVLNEYGQRISIRIVIPHKTQGGTVSFVTGWMVCPDGRIELITPYGGK